LGTPTQMYDENGTLVWECELDIYGKAKIKRGNLTDVPFRWQGQMEDEELGGVYINRYRFYDSESGIFLSSDPISVLGGLNTYAYVHDTNTWIDPLGLMPWPNPVKKGHHLVVMYQMCCFMKYQNVNYL